MEIKERITYTESALSDRFVEFFKTFKNESGSYAYVELIDSSIYPPHHIKIDFDELTEELKEIVKNESEIRLHFAIYRSIGEIFQARYGGAELQVFHDNNFFKFEILNFENYSSKIFESPQLIYWNNADDGVLVNFGRHSAYEFVP